MGGLLALIAVAVVVGVPMACVVLWMRTAGLQRRVESLERSIEVMRRQGAASGPLREDATFVPRPPPEAAPASAPAQVPPAAAAASTPPQQDKPGEAARGSRTWSSPPWPREPDWLEQALQRIWSWFTEGNVPVKVGMVVLFAGVGALLKYAADKGWMDFPIPVRLAGIALVALAGLVFGWRQRRQRRTFALSVQGGALGVLLMTAYAAFKLYALVSPAAAFAIWVLLAAAAGLLALWQDARVLAVLGILAGFMAPLLMSTGAGNHVVLFAFYAVLNAAIFGIAWLRSWRVLNLLGFAFTFGIGSVWGVLRYQPAHFASTLPFLVLFFAFYLLLPILHARRGKGGPRDPVDACLVFGTPLVSFVHLAALLEGERLPLAACAVGLAALYALLLAWPLASPRAPLLRQAHAALAVGFATLAVPLAFSAHTTASVLALEGAALVWLGLAQSRPLPRIAGGALQLLAALSYLRGVAGVVPGTAIVNAGFMGALLLAVAGIATAWNYQRAKRRDPAQLWYLWALAWWLVMGAREIARFVPADAMPDAWLGFAALTAVLAAFGLRRAPVQALAWTVALSLAAALPLCLARQPHPFHGWGPAAWVAFAAGGLIALRALRPLAGTAVRTAVAAWLLAWALAASLYLRWAGDVADLASGWRLAAIFLPWVAVGAALQWRARWILWPLRPDEGNTGHAGLLSLWQLLLGAGALVLVLAPGDTAPLPFIPLLNPVELMLVGALVLFAEWTLRGAPAAVKAQRTRLLTLAMFLLVTSATLRAAHHLAATPWDAGMFREGAVQASLSLVWSVLGVVGWIAGSRRHQRELWRAGALLMGVVLAKLVLVDRLHLGNLPGIASFIGYGLLCTVVGYLAPAPPRAQEA